MPVIYSHFTKNSETLPRWCKMVGRVSWDLAFFLGVN